MEGPKLKEMWQVKNSVVSNIDAVQTHNRKAYKQMASYKKSLKTIVSTTVLKNITISRYCRCNK